MLDLDLAFFNWEIITRFVAKGFVFSVQLTLVAMAGGVLCGGILAGWPLDPARTGGFMVMLLLTGGLFNGVQTTMYALAAHVYPTAIRSTGVGTAVAIGRIGNVLAAYAASMAIDLGGSPTYFVLWSVLMLLVLVALACIRRHVPGMATSPEPRTAVDSTPSAVRRT